MNTEQMWMNHGELVIEGFEELLPDRLESVRRFVELTRHVQEIRDLYRVLRFNIALLTEHYTLMNSGKILRGGKPADTEEDHIAINALTGNILGSTQTLLKSMECYVKENYPKNAAEQVAHLKNCSDAYDGSFAYRLMIRLRDYSQHGHLPVSREGENYSIQLYHILHRSHYRHNATLREELKKVAEEIMEVYGDTPTLSLTMTIAEFTAQLFSVYRKFWDCIGEGVLYAAKDAENVVKEYPQNLYGGGEGVAPMFIFEISEKDHMAHTFWTGDDTEKLLSDIRQEAEEAEREFSDYWQYLREGMLTIRMTEDRQCIEVGGL